MENPSNAPDIYLSEVNNAGVSKLEKGAISNAKRNNPINAGVPIKRHIVAIKATHKTK